MRKAEIETVKAMLHKQSDRARPAYGHFMEDQPRCSIETGTTNSDEYLLSQTGNRRFWPIKILKPIDLAAVRAARLQLLGEAAYYQSKGESLVLPEKLWAEAVALQEERRVKHPWEDILRPWLTFMENPPIRKALWNTNKSELRITTATLFDLLEIPMLHQGLHSKQLADVMRVMGWENTLIKNRGRSYKKSIEKINAEMAADKAEEDAEMASAAAKAGEAR